VQRTQQQRDQHQDDQGCTERFHMCVRALRDRRDRLRV
jgi:hypothetical protein